mmetsp:Transcript_24010/g.70825  ORF Transcript_24010/g.70825 Transcript_24010/m.70825 type:complete len:187 (-) Transcript_24010:2847-3407(-)
MACNAKTAIDGLKKNLTKPAIRLLTEFCELMVVPTIEEEDEDIPGLEDDNGSVLREDSYEKLDIAGEEADAPDVGSKDESGAEVEIKIVEFSNRVVSELFGVNQEAKYYANGVKKRRAFNDNLQLTGYLAIGEKVSCRGGDNATLIVRAANGAVTVQLHPYETANDYKSEKSAQMMRRQPALDGYD